MLLIIVQHLPRNRERLGLRPVHMAGRLELTSPSTGRSRPASSASPTSGSSSVRMAAGLARKVRSRRNPEAPATSHAHSTPRREVLSNQGAGSGITFDPVPRMEHKYEAGFVKSDPETPQTTQEQIALAREAARKLGVPNADSAPRHRVGRNSQSASRRS